MRRFAKIIRKSVELFSQKLSFESESAASEYYVQKLREQVIYEGPDSVAAIVMETVTGSNGVIIPPEGYLKGVRSICDEFGIMMICDEVMAGWGRTGTFPMPKRRDALYAAAQALCYLHSEIDSLGIDELVYTTGEIVCHPCVHTCVPDYVDFSIDVRHKDPDSLNRVLAVVKSCADREWSGCSCVVEKAWNRDTVYYDERLIGYVKEAAEECGIPHMYIHSGAGHDAQFAAYMMPTTMVFCIGAWILSRTVQEKGSLSFQEPLDYRI